jgi:hypothetical protein
MKERKWQARFRNSIGGILFGGARRSGRGEWKRAEQIPGEVKKYLHIERGKGAAPVWHQRDWKRLSAMHDECKPESHFHRNFLIVNFTVKEEKCERAPAIEVDFPKLRTCLRDLNEGRNLDSCFDLCSFGWKDADLDPHGCCGIKELVRIAGKQVIVDVGGHKTLCNPCGNEGGSEMSDCDWEAHAIVCECGSNCEWDGDSWCAWFEETLRLPIVHKRNVVNYEATARRIVRLAIKACKPYQERWAETDKHLDELYKRIQKENENAVQLM